MITMTLQDYLKEKTQSELAEAIGVTQGAVWQMVRSGRNIEITINDDGTVTAHEIKPIGRRNVAA